MQWRSIVHYLILLPLWALFFWGWYLILFTWPRAELVASLRLLALCVSLCGIVITLWIRHNIRIFRRKGPRRHVRQVQANFTNDVVGRPVTVLTPDMLRDSYVVLDLKDGKKIYSSGIDQGLDRDTVLTAVSSE